MNDTDLLAVLMDLERRSRPAVVSFIDGEVLELRVVETMHAEEGGDFAAELIRVVAPRRAGSAPVGSFINCSLAEVVEVSADGVASFERRVDA